MRKKLLAISLAMLLGVSALASSVLAEGRNPVEVSAETLEYNSSTGVINAKGKVVIKQDVSTITGSAAEYNMKTKQALVNGGVKLVREDVTLVADEVRSFNDNHIVASGENLLLTKGTSSLKAPVIEYLTDQQYAFTSGGWAEMNMAEGFMSAGKIEAFFIENRVVGTGDVHIISDTNKLDAVSDYAEYYTGQQGETGKVMLSGNARANQDGNILTGSKLTLYMGDKEADAEGRARLVIKPTE